jgi:hypothetical protein
MTELLVLPQDCAAAAVQVTQALAGCGLNVVRSFDLRHVWPRTDGVPDTALPPKAALVPPAACGCAYHGTAPCDCQMVIMLVYGATGTPATLVAHGHDGVTWFTLVDTPEQRPSPDLATVITTILQGEMCDIALAP